MPKANTNANCVSVIADEIASIWQQPGLGYNSRIRLDHCFNNLAANFLQAESDLSGHLFELALPPKMEERLQSGADIFVREQSATLLSQGLEHFSREGLKAFFFSALYENLRFHPLLRPEEENLSKRSRYKRRSAAYFTPPSLAYLAVQRAFAFYKKEGLPRICDPAMGSGLYLVAALDYLGLAHPQLERSDIVDQSIFGIELDAVTCGVAKNCLTIAGGACTSEFSQNLLWADALSCDLSLFDIVLGNPPWDIAKVTRGAADVKVSSRVNKSKIAQLRRGFVHQGEGDTSYYKLFLERAHQILSPDGVCALLLPASFCGDKGAAPLRRLLWQSCRWHTLDGFINEDNAFAIHPHFKYVLVCYQKGATTQSVDTRFGLRASKDRLLGTAGSAKSFEYSSHLATLLSGEAQAIIELGGAKDAELLLALTAKHAHLSDFLAVSGAVMQREYDMTIDRHRFVEYKKDLVKDSVRDLEKDPEKIFLPLLEGAMIGQFQVSKGSSSPRFMVKKSDFACRVAAGALRLGFVSTSSPFNTRSMIASCLPDWPAANSLPVINFAPGADSQNSIAVIAPVEAALYTSAIFNSFVFDWIIRLKLSGNNLSFYLLQETPFPSPFTLDEQAWKCVVALSAPLTFGTECCSPMLESKLIHQFQILQDDTFYKQVCDNCFSQKEEKVQYRGATNLLRTRICLEILIGFLFDLTATDMSYILRDCSFGQDTLIKRRRLMRSKVGEEALPAPDQRSFFRVDKTLQPHLRLTNLVERSYESFHNGKHKFVDDLFLSLKQYGQCPPLPLSVEEALAERFAPMRERSVV